MRLGLAFRAFFAVLLKKEMAAPMERLLLGRPAAESSIDNQKVKAAERPAPTPKPTPSRDSAITLLATLQHEARLIDLIHEDLSQYSDAQVGAAARPCLKQCAAVLHRLFHLQPLVQAKEGETVDVGENASPMRYQWIGEGTATSGTLVHHGWEAAAVELPKWLGEAADANIIAPAQVQAR